MNKRVVVSPSITQSSTHLAPRTLSPAPPLMRTPSRAPTPQPTITAVGVAKPNAQGQATTTTLMALKNAMKAEWPVTTHMKNVKTEMPTMVGAKMAEIRSA